MKYLRAKFLIIIVIIIIITTTTNSMLSIVIADAISVYICGQHKSSFT